MKSYFNRVNLPVFKHTVCCRAVMLTDLEKQEYLPLFGCGIVHYSNIVTPTVSLVFTAEIKHMKCVLLCHIFVKMVN